eukprot:820767-Prymnesium_polylepis.1
MPRAPAAAARWRRRRGGRCRAFATATRRPRGSRSACTATRQMRRARLETGSSLRSSTPATWCSPSICPAAAPALARRCGRAVSSTSRQVGPHRSSRLSSPRSAGGAPR